MAAGHWGITALLATLLCFASSGLSPSYGFSNQDWYSSALSRVLRFVNVEAQVETNGKNAEKQVARPYVSRIVKEDGSITLKDNVPSENDFKILQGVVAATLPGATLIDRTRIVAEVEDRDTWLAGMTYALRQLAKLEKGRARLSGNVISIDGLVKADDNFTAVQQRLIEELPKGLILQSAGLKPPPVKPFIWLAQVKAGRLNISGHVPTDEDQSSLMLHAKSFFDEARIDNSMTSASGAPPDWILAAKICVEMLTLLQHGSATVQDRNIRLDGVYTSQAAPELLKTFMARVPKGFKIELNLAAFAPVRSPSAQGEELNFAGRNPQGFLNP